MDLVEQAVRFTAPSPDVQVDRRVTRSEEATDRPKRERVEPPELGGRLRRLAQPRAFGKVELAPSSPSPVLPEETPGLLIVHDPMIVAVAYRPVISRIVSFGSRSVSLALAASS